MSEYMWANIKIGGSISRLVLTHLAEKFAVSSPLSEEAGAGSASPEAPHYLELEDDEAVWGRFDELETYLMGQAIPFDRLSDGGYESSPELRKFRPRLTNDSGNTVQPEVDRTFLCDHDNHPAVTVTDIEKAIAETRTREELAARLTELCGLDIPALPPLSVVDATN